MQSEPSLEDVAQYLDDPMALLSTPKGHKVLEKAIEYFAQAAINAVRIPSMPEVRDKIDRNLKVDILREAMGLYSLSGKMHVLLGCMGHEDFKRCAAPMRMLFCEAYSLAFHKEEALRTTCRKTMELYITNFKEKCENDRLEW
jgi:hypothetical protein